MDKQELEEGSPQKQALEESLVRGQAFEELIRTKGWEYIKQWYQAKVQLLASDLLLTEKKQIAEFESERRELIGIRKLLGHVDNDIQILRKYNEQQSKRSAAK